MPRFTLTARFPDAASADAARLAVGKQSRVVADAADLGRHESRFMGRIFVIVALWSVFGTAFGAGLGVLISTVFGPHGTQGLILQAVSWAIFAHLIGGLWAGYWLLADRTREDLPIPGHDAVLLVVECASIDETDATAARLRELGASNVTRNAPAGGR